DNINSFAKFQRLGLTVLSPYITKLKSTFLILYPANVEIDGAGFGTPRSALYLDHNRLTLG
ncbi:MAG: hypothetical protein ACKVG6_10620, partial [Alphaproteobacteria bacterium]